MARHRATTLIALITAAVLAGCGSASPHPAVSAGARARSSTTGRPAQAPSSGPAPTGPSPSPAADGTGTAGTGTDGNGTGTAGTGTDGNGTGTAGTGTSAANAGTAAGGAASTTGGARATTTTAKAAPPTTAASTACPSTLAGQLASTGGGTQLITVVAGSTSSTTASVTLWQRAGTCWAQAAGPWGGRVGYNGLSSHHREGDGTTPLGLFAISSAFYGIAPNPGVHGSYHQLVCGDWWDEDPTSAQYNTFQHVACATTPPFGGGSEALWRQTTAYQNFAVVQYNSGPVVPYAGSAIFIHDDLGGGTNGCISLPPSDLITLLRWLEPGQSPHIAIGTGSTIRQT